MNSLEIVSPVRTFNPLSTDDLRRCAPSIFAEHPIAGVSSRYRFVSTARVIEQLAESDWLPVKASEQRVRLPQRKGFQMHEVRFARAADLGTRHMVVGEVRPELVLQNAHDGTRAYRIDAGLYRLVCRNGLTVADTNFEHVSIRHKDVEPQVFVQASQHVAENAPRLLALIDRWKEVSLSDSERTQFAVRAAELRWSPGDAVLSHFSPQELLRPVRSADRSTDLWTTFNVIQEHLIRGGDRYVTSRPGAGRRRHRTLSIGSLTEAQQINKQLWALAGEYLRN